MSHHWGYGGNNGECGGRGLRAARSRSPLRHLPSTAAPVAQPGCLGPSRVPVLGCPWRHSERCRGSDLKPSRPRTGARRDSPTQNRKQYLWGPQLVTVCKPRQNRTKIVTNILVVGHRKIKGRGRVKWLLSPSHHSLPHLWLSFPAYFVTVSSGASLNLIALAPEFSIHFLTSSVLDNRRSSWSQT